MAYLRIVSTKVFLQPSPEAAMLSQGGDTPIDAVVRAVTGLIGES